jgi:hypothetical protein
MKLTRLAAIVLPAAALVAVGVPLAAHAATAHTTTTSTTGHVTASAPSVAVYNCNNKAQVRPKTFYVFCDSSGYLANLKWTNWNSTMATATGQEYIDNCVPNCAAGKFSHQNVNVIFWRSEPVAHHSNERGYSQMTILYPNAKISKHNTVTSTPPGVFPGEF